MSRAAVLALILVASCRIAPAGRKMSAKPDGGDHGGGAALALKELPIPGAAKIDGLRLVETAHGPSLLVSTQVCRSPRMGFGDCAMEVKAVSPGDPAHATVVANLPRPLPPPPRWDARATEDGRFEILFEEAGGALYKLLLRAPTGAMVSPSGAEPMASFVAPRFVRSGAERSATTVTASKDGKTLVVFANANPPAAPAPLADAPEGVAGSAGGPWVVARTTFGGESAFGALPGRLALLRLSKLEGGAVTSTIAFPGFLAYEFDAAPLGADVVVFATSKPAALLLGSRPSRPIALAAPERRWLGSLSRPTLSTGGGNVRVAAIANPGTEDARILYGDFPAGALQQP